MVQAVNSFPIGDRWCPYCRRNGCGGTDCPAPISPFEHQFTSPGIRFDPPMMVSSWRKCTICGHGHGGEGCELARQSREAFRAYVERPTGAALAPERQIEIVREGDAWMLRINIPLTDEQLAAAVDVLKAAKAI